MGQGRDGVLQLAVAGSAGGYPADEASIEASEGAIADFLTDFAERCGATAVHVIAHSMGNRGLLRAVSGSRRGRSGDGETFGQVFLAAADVDADVFRQLARPIPKSRANDALYLGA